MKLLPMHSFTGSSKDLQLPNFIYEPKLDGYRSLCYANEGLKFISRNGNNITQDYPEFKFRDHINAKDCILDGEIVVFDKNGDPSFQLLQQGFVEATYIVFDILKKNGKSLTSLPLSERKKILDATIEDGDHIEKILFTSDGKQLYKNMAKYHLEGVIAKDFSSHYYPNKRSSKWLKIKHHKTVDAIIIGFTQGKRKVSSLALGLYDKEQKLHYIGKVGTGFSQELLEDLNKKFQKLERKKLALVSPIPLRKIHWLKPSLVAEIKYLKVTHAGLLRAPVFLRQRTDKNAQDCVIDQLKTKTIV